VRRAEYAIARCMANNSPIGIFDSGIGGLTVYSAIKHCLPAESLVYLGDTARVPYGTKSDETVVRYALEDAAFLEGRGVKAIVVACNTASAVALPALRERCGVPVVGVVEPGARAAMKASSSKRVGVIGTRATIASDAYGEALRALDNGVHVASAVCSLFVPIVEEGWLDGAITEDVVRRYVSELKQADIDTLILGCTHYPLLKGAIGRVMGDGVVLVDSGEATASEIAAVLDEQGSMADGAQDQPDLVFVTDVPAAFESVAASFLQGSLPRVQRINL